MRNWVPSTSAKVAVLHQRMVAEYGRATRTKSGKWHPTGSRREKHGTRRFRRSLLVMPLIADFFFRESPIIKFLKLPRPNPLEAYRG